MLSKATVEFTIKTRSLPSVVLMVSVDDSIICTTKNDMFGVGNYFSSSLAKMNRAYLIVMVCGVCFTSLPTG